MLPWIAALACLCAVSAALGLGHVFPLTASAQGMFLALTALSGVLLVSTFDAYETTTQSAGSDSEHDL
jgi:hypothetical protein